MKKTLSAAFIMLLLILQSNLLLSRSLAPTNDEKKVRKILKMYEGYKKSFASAADLSVLDALELWGQENVVFVDDREKKEQSVSMIPGAVASKKFKQSLNQYNNYKVIVYCTIGNRSGHFTRKLSEKGIKAYNLIGGILLWVHRGGKVTTEDRETNRVHVYGKKWNLIPEGYEAIW